MVAGWRGVAGNESRSEVRALFMMLSPKAAALSDRGFCQSTIALPVPYVALISSEGIVLPSNATLHIVSSREYLKQERHSSAFKTRDIC